MPEANRCTIRTYQPRNFGSKQYPERKRRLVLRWQRAECECSVLDFLQEEQNFRLKEVT